MPRDRFTKKEKIMIAVSVFVGAILGLLTVNAFFGHNMESTAFLGADMEHWGLLLGSMAGLCICVAAIQKIAVDIIVFCVCLCAGYLLGNFVVATFFNPVSQHSQHFGGILGALLVAYIFRYFNKHPWA